MKQYFLPRTDGDKLSWLQNFSSKLAAYKVKYGISDAEVADMVTGYNYLNYWVNYANQYAGYVRKLNEFKQEIRDGVSVTADASVAPAPPVITGAPASVKPALMKRALALANVIKKKGNYTEADGKDLGLEGAEEEAANRSAAKPPISLRPVAGGNVEIIWKKQKIDAIDIYVKRADSADWQFLATDTTPNYIDTAALPKSGTSEVWHYKAIYRDDDAQTGLWSDEVSITVTGI